MKKKHIHHRHQAAKVPRRRKGFALAEILIVVAIVGVVQSLLFISWRGQVSKANDTKRKDDMAKIRSALEDYYNDNQCYPAASTFATCGGTELSPYMTKTPCDPTTKNPYYYVPLDSDPCTGYRLLTTLDNTGDPAIVALGCNGPEYCGFGGKYNYGIASGTKVLAPGITPPAPTPTPTPVGGIPTPTPTGTQYACSPQGTCNVYANPVGSGCPLTFTLDTCEGACSNPANRCTE